MKNQRATSRNSLFAILLAALFLMVIYGCAPRIYVSSYFNPEFDFSKIKKVAIVLKKQKIGTNLLFADIFTQTALEKKNFFLVAEDYIPEEDISKSNLRTDADAFLKISLTHCYAGFRTRSSPTSVGASAELVHTGTGKMVWNMSYSYSSAKTGRSAPILEEVMKIVSWKIIDCIPLEYVVPPVAVAEEEQDVSGTAIAVPVPPIAAPTEELASMKLESPAPSEEKPVLAGGEVPFTSGPYLVHAASVQAKRRDAAEEFIDGKTPDGTVRLAKLVDLKSKGRWYRLLIGRFKSMDDCWSYIRKSWTSHEIIDKESRPVKLPFSLLISSGESLDTAKSLVEGLRKKNFMVYLSPPAGKTEAYDVLVGAYESQKEAVEKAEALLQDNIQAQVISP